jgi:hypothetical protein
LYLSPFIFTPGFAPAKKPICQVLAMLFCWHVPQQWEYFYHRNQSTKIDSLKIYMFICYILKELDEYS